MTENEAMDLDKLIVCVKALAKEKDTLARTFRGFKDYGNPKSTITSGAEKAQTEAEQYEQMGNWLEELKQYRSIGTVEEFKALKEKATKKSRILREGKYYCCSCSRIAKTSGHCSYCGQLLY